MIGVGLVLTNLVKREASEILARTRRCNREVSFPQVFVKSHWQKPGRRNEMMILKSEDLPVMVL